jgi:hypothetical protein
MSTRKRRRGQGRIHLRGSSLPVAAEPVQRELVTGSPANVDTADDASATKAKAISLFIVGYMFPVIYDVSQLPSFQKIFCKVEKLKKFEQLEAISVLLQAPYPSKFVLNSIG